MTARSRRHKPLDELEIEAAVLRDAYISSH